MSKMKVGIGIFYLFPPLRNKGGEDGQKGGTFSPNHGGQGYFLFFLFQWIKGDKTTPPSPPPPNPRAKWGSFLYDYGGSGGGQHKL